VYLNTKNTQKIPNKLSITKIGISYNKMKNIGFINPGMELLKGDNYKCFLVE